MKNLPLQNRDGGRREVEFVSNIYSENGHRVIQCNIRDITDRKRLERRLEEQASNTLAAIRYALPHIQKAPLDEPSKAGLDLAHMRLVAMTGWGQDEHRRHTSEAGLDNHLTKPTDPEDLEKLLAKFAAERAQNLADV